MAVVPPSTSTKEIPGGTSERTKVPCGLVRAVMFVPVSRTVTFWSGAGGVPVLPVDWMIPLIEVLTLKMASLRTSPALLWTIT